MGRAALFIGIMLGGVMAVPASAASTTVALWHMDESGGTTMLDSVGENPGTLHNVVAGVPGWLGTGYRFDGQSSYVEVPSSPQLNPGTAPIKFTVHVRYTVTPPAGTASDYDVLRKGTASDSAQFYKLEIRPDNRAVCRFVGSKTSSTGLLIHTGPVLNDGQWHTLTCKKRNDRIKLIIDGTSYTKMGAVGSISNTGPLTLGAKPGRSYTDYYNGDLDEASIAIG